MISEYNEDVDEDVEALKELNKTMLTDYNITKPVHVINVTHNKFINNQANTKLTANDVL